MFMGISLHDWFVSGLMVLFIMTIASSIPIIAIKISKRVNEGVRQKKAIKNGKGVSFMDRYFADYYEGVQKCQANVINAPEPTIINVARHVYSVPVCELLDVYLDIKMKRVKSFDDRTEMRFYQNKPLSLDMGYQKN